MVNNVYGSWRLCQAFIQTKENTRNYTYFLLHIIGITLYYMEEESGTAACAISKPSLNVPTRKLAAVLPGTGILVNSIDPGWLAIDMGGHGGGSVSYVVVLQSSSICLSRVSVSIMTPFLQS